MALSQELQDALAVWRVATQDLELSEQIIETEQAKRSSLEVAITAAIDAISELETEGLSDYYYIDDEKLFHLEFHLDGTVRLQELDVKT